ncbi:MAG: DUF4124 domain-containing protein [Bdellovibrio bacteriovorus]
MAQVSIDMRSLPLPHRPARRRLALVVAAALLLPSLAEARVYRWVDEQGVVHYTDQIPPTQVDKGHTALSDKGIPLETVPPAQTLEELKREQELKRLRAEQERLLEQQRAADRVLLSSFRSVDDLIMARDGKLASVDVVIGVARSNIRREQQRLGQLRSEAADLERAGKPIPPHMEESIAKTERAIRDSYSSIVDRERQKEEIRVAFERDHKRFRQLKEIPEDQAQVPEDPSRPALGNLVSCAGREQCARLWDRAVAFVRQHATTPIETAGPNILITAAPKTSDDLSLALSLIQDQGQGEASLFLDMQCKNPGSGDLDCREERVLRVLDGFRRAVADP